LIALSVAHGGVKDAVVALRAAKAKVDPLVGGYRRLVLTMYAGATQTLADFGLPPPKAKAPRTSQQNAAAAAKAKSTRTARGTASRKKKLAIKGDVKGIVVVPITEPAITPPSPQPANAPPAQAPAAASPAPQPASNASSTPTTGASK
jgi:hypothetical protein